MIVLAGCFSQPPRPAPSDGSGGGGDALVPCNNPGPWDATPTAIDLPMSTNDAATSPWLSDDGNDLYFSLLPMGDPTMPVLSHSHRTNGVWANATPVVLASLVKNDNPFLADDQALWFDNADTSMRTIYEAPPDGQGGFATPVAHPELGAAKEPSLTPSGAIIYYASASLAQVYRGTTTTPGLFGNSVMLVQGNDGIEAPTIDAMNDMIFFSDYASEGERIYQATFDTDKVTLVGTQRTGTFQTGTTNAAYFDPNISRDGRTMVFAARPDGTSHAHLFYVQRPCN